MITHNAIQLASLGRQGLTVATARQRAVLVRYGAPHDADLLVAMYRRLSERSVRLRFGGPRRHLTDAALRDEMAEAMRSASLVGTVGEGSARSAVALVQLVQLPQDPGTAEVAIVVRDDYQREGVGRALCGMIGEVARARGVRRLRVDTLAENQAVLRLISKLGARYTADTRRGETRVMIELGDAPAA